jgi:valyl-tRNA synthetase
MMHPFAPFVTEELWDHLPGRQDGPRGALMVSEFPKIGSHNIDPAAKTKWKR